MKFIDSIVGFFSERHYKLYYTTLFVSFGVLIAILTSVADYRMNITNIQTEISNKAMTEFGSKQKEIAIFTSGVEEYITALRTSNLLANYIRHPTQENFEIVRDLFYTITSSDSSFMQVRYLDVDGHERIRIDWDYGHERPVIIPSDKLQDKSHRYYFVEASQVPANSFWYSRLDLNVENRKIEVPHKPVLRVASPVYVDQQFLGIVIINAHAEEFLNKFMESSIFDISLVDHEGFFLTHHQKNLSWSRYLQTGYTLLSEFPERGRNILGSVSPAKIQSYGNVYAASVASYLQKDRAILLLQPKTYIVETMEAERFKATLFIALIIFLLSLPLSFFIARLPARLYQKISKQNVVLTEYFEIIDTNILSCSADASGTFSEVSTAFARKAGFDKDEMTGLSYLSIRHPDVAEDFYVRIWKEIQAGQTWQGEIAHLSKNGDSYWTDAIIYPKRDANLTIVGCSAIHHDITDKKRIQELSVTDDLTGLFNRRFFNETIVNELNRAQRDNRMLAFAMLDVDYFKQFNDHYGHQKGDEVLTAIGQTLQQKLGRASDTCFRLGGEEFGLIFTDVSPAEALRFVEGIRQAIEAIGIEHRWSEVAETVTVSAGLLSVTPGPGITVDAIYKKADEALYDAKRLGRNQVVPALLDSAV